MLPFPFLQSYAKAAPCTEKPHQVLGEGWHFHVNGKFYINVRLAARLLKHWNLLTSWQDRIPRRRRHFWGIRTSGFDVLVEFSPDDSRYRHSCHCFSNNKNILFFSCSILFTSELFCYQIIYSLLALKVWANRSRNHRDKGLQARNREMVLCIWRPLYSQNILGATPGSSLPAH